MVDQASRPCRRGGQLADTNAAGHDVSERRGIKPHTNPTARRILQPTVLMLDEAELTGLSESR